LAMAGRKMGARFSWSAHACVGLGEGSGQGQVVAAGLGRGADKGIVNVVDILDGLRA